MKPKVIVFAGKGLNCERESVYAWNLAGADAVQIDTNDILDSDEGIDLKDYQIIMFPGGFSYGDDTGSANALAKELKYNKRISEAILEFSARPDKLILGVCNGFQAMVNLGLIPALQDNYTEPEVALIFNTSNTYEARPAYLTSRSKKCIFTRELDSPLYSPVAHGEGRFYAPPETLDSLTENDCIVFTYSDKNNNPAKGKYPINPNGSLKDIAAICDKTGRFMGMMPHPERTVELRQVVGAQKIFDALRRENRQPKRRHYKGRDVAIGPGLAIFDNAVTYFE